MIELHLMDEVHILKTVKVTSTVSDAFTELMEHVVEISETLYCKVSDTKFDARRLLKRSALEGIASKPETADEVTDWSAEGFSVVHHWSSDA